jgi:hypothetical protein
MALLVMLVLMGMWSSIDDPTALSHLCTFLLLLRYSRRILWLHVAVTNNQPAVIGGYFVSCVKALGGV